MATLKLSEPAETSLVYLIKNYSNYNLWANETTINWLKTKPAEKLEQEVASSFPSIKLTLIHIWQTQNYWLSIIKGNGESFEGNFEDNVPEILDGILQQSRELTGFVESMSQELIQKDTAVFSQWFQCNLPNFEYIQHVVNHTTYHRGQVVTIGRALGFTDAPMTDYNFYNVMGKIF